MNLLTREFYQQDVISLSKALLGKTIVHHFNGNILQAVISDVEAYAGVVDRAAHSYGGRKTNRTQVLWRLGGYSYVYLIYGMYNCFNVVAEDEHSPCAVLIRGVFPIGPLDEMSQLRYKKNYSELSRQQIENFSNGPGKVCMALGITREQNGMDLLGDQLYILDAPSVDPKKIRVGKRINIDYAQEAKDFLYRFTIEKNEMEENQWETNR